MKDAFVKLKNDLQALTDDLYKVDFFTPQKVLVIGCSTSETIGEHIGKNSSDEAAEVIYKHFSEIAAKKIFTYYSRGANILTVP